MSSPPVTPNPSSAPTIPLTPELRAAYQSLYDSFETAIEGTRDPGVHEALLGAQGDVEDVLTKDDLYRLEANTALYETLLGQINDTNTGLAALKAQIEAISSDVSMFGAIVAGITKVLSLAMPA